MRRVLAGTSKLLITVGLLVLIFVVYQLWGTGIYTALAQDRLQRDFQTTLDATSDETASPFEYRVYRSLVVAPDAYEVLETDPPRPATLAFGALTFAVGGLRWLVFHRHPRRTTWVLDAAPFIVALAFLSYSLERMLPSNC